MTDESGRRVWLYADAASGNQVEAARKVRFQISRLRRYAQENGWQVVGVTRNLPSNSVPRGRLGLSSLRNFLGSEVKFDILLVESRDTLLMSLLERMLVAEGRELHTLDGGLLSRAFSSTIEEHQRLRLSERARERRLTAARAGHWVDAAPYGYIAVRGSDGHRFLETIKEEAEVVRKAFDLAIFRHGTVRQVAESLNGAGCATRRGNRWSASAVDRMLRNPIYFGRGRFRANIDVENIAESITGIGVKVPRIISRELFYEVQRILRERKTPKMRGGPHVH